VIWLIIALLALCYLEGYNNYTDELLEAVATEAAKNRKQVERGDRQRAMLLGTLWPVLILIQFWNGLWK
jgi:hypothetical protein